MKGLGIEFRLNNLYKSGALSRKEFQKAKNILNWEPKYSLDEGLLETIEWYKNKISYN